MTSCANSLLPFDQSVPAPPSAASASQSTSDGPVKRKRVVQPKATSPENTRSTDPHGKNHSHSRKPKALDVRCVPSLFSSYPSLCHSALCELRGIYDSARNMLG